MIFPNQCCVLEARKKWSLLLPSGSKRECPFCKVPLAAFNYMGYTMRTAAERFTAWVPFDNATLRVDWNRSVALELYDLTDDDGRDFDFAGYSSNLALDPAYASRVDELLPQLKAAVESWY